MIAPFVERLEVLEIVRDDDVLIFSTPFEQRLVRGLFAHLVFRLYYLNALLTEYSNALFTCSSSRNRGATLLDRFLRLQTFLAECVECGTVRSLGSAHFLRVGIVIRERCVNLRKGNIELIRNVSGRATTVENHRDHLTNPYSRPFNSRFATEDFVDCEQAVIAHVEAAHTEGATIRARERVLDWHETGDSVRVKTDKDRYETDDLVVTAGAWAGEFFTDLAAELTPCRRIMVWLQPEKREQFQPEAFPVFSLAGEHSDGYGFPIHDVPGFKFGREPSLPNAVDPDEMPREPTTIEEERHREFADAYFPNGAGPTMRLRTCVITESCDGHFVLGSHPHYDGVHVAAGFTGHGFKFTAVVGDILADFVTAGDTDHAVDPHRIERLFDM